MSWNDWAAGVLDQIGAPLNATNTDTLWAWSNAESDPYPVMHINNPLDTTWFMPGATAWNTFGNNLHVWIYASVQDAITATVSTLLDGRYPIIVGHLQNSVPRQQWGDACAELGTWGTGCGWLSTNYGTASGSITGEDDLTPDEHNVLVDIQNRLANSVQPAISFIENDVVGGVEDNAKGIAATVHRIEAAVAKIPTTEPPEPTPAPPQPALSAQEAADIHTIADFLRKFGAA